MSETRARFEQLNLPEMCWEICQSAETCLLTGCELQRIRREEARSEQLLKEARAH
jgi:hypothetical protein